MKTTYNINRNCYVILTEYGAKILNDYHKKLKQMICDENLHKFYSTEYIEGSEYSAPLWNIMQIFGGDNIYMGSNIPFVNNEIAIDDKIN